MKYVGQIIVMTPDIYKHHRLYKMDHKKTATLFTHIFKTFPFICMVYGKIHECFAP